MRREGGCVGGGEEVEWEQKDARGRRVTRMPCDSDDWWLECRVTRMTGDSDALVYSFTCTWGPRPALLCRRSCRRRGAVRRRGAARASHDTAASWCCEVQAEALAADLAGGKALNVDQKAKVDAIPEIKVPMHTHAYTRARANTVIHARTRALAPGRSPAAWVSLF